MAMGDGCGGSAAGVAVEARRRVASDVSMVTLAVSLISVYVRSLASKSASSRVPVITNENATAGLKDMPGSSGLGGGKEGGGGALVALAAAASLAAAPVAVATGSLATPAAAKPAAIAVASLLGPAAAHLERVALAHHDGVHAWRAAALGVPAAARHERVDAGCRCGRKDEAAVLLGDPL